MALGISVVAVADLNLNNFAAFPDPTGRIRTVSPAGPHDDPSNPFFQSLGTTGEAVRAAIRRRGMGRDAAAYPGTL